jgi:hypothetical protein
MALSQASSRKRGGRYAGSLVSTRSRSTASASTVKPDQRLDPAAELRPQRLRGHRQASVRYPGRGVGNAPMVRRGSAKARSDRGLTSARRSGLGGAYARGLPAALSLVRNAMQCGLRLAVPLELLGRRSEGRSAERELRAAALSRSEAGYDLAAETECRHRVANALLGSRKDGADHLAQFLERGTSHRFDAGEIVVDGVRGALCFHGEGLRYDGSHGLTDPDRARTSCPLRRHRSPCGEGRMARRQLAQSWPGREPRARPRTWVYGPGAAGALPGGCGGSVSW